jgi:hypothetical protein
VAEITISLLIFPSIAVLFQSARATPGNGDAKQGGILKQGGSDKGACGHPAPEWSSPIGTDPTLKRPSERSLERAGKRYTPAGHDYSSKHRGTGLRRAKLEIAPTNSAGWSEKLENRTRPAFPRDYHAAFRGLKSLHTPGAARHRTGSTHKLIELKNLKPQTLN